jgi:hypothetical protein
MNVRLLCLSAVVATIFLTTAARGATISPQEYAERLDRIAMAVEAGDLRTAREDAKTLLKEQVGGPHGKSGTDRTILGPLSRESSKERARAHAERIAQLVRSLKADTGGPRDPAAKKADDALLKRIRKREALGEARAGGDVAAFPYQDSSFAERIQNMLADAAEWVWERIGPWVGDALEGLLRWLGRLFLGTRVSSGGGIDVTRLVVVILVVVAAVVGGLLAWHVLRNRGRPAIRTTAALSGPVASSSEDEDALSRTSTEWERYAAELEAAGRAREAIRAWYHALLVTLFRAGHLHHRKGRTNWEYAYALAPSVVWRSRFTEIVRSFEREWYGRTSSAVDVEHMFAGEAKTLLRDVRGGAK